MFTQSEIQEKAPPGEMHNECILLNLGFLLHILLRLQKHLHMGLLTSWPGLDGAQREGKDCFSVIYNFSVPSTVVEFTQPSLASLLSLANAGQQ